ncbi:MAG: hypothetical protein PVI57_13300 [Gemmatimonadota bacterium]|jgi:hypothetical protein
MTTRRRRTVPRDEAGKLIAGLRERGATKIRRRPTGRRDRVEVLWEPSELDRRREAEILRLYRPILALAALTLVVVVVAFLVAAWLTG